MAISYSWHFNQLDTAVQEGENQNVIKKIHYTYKAEHSDDPMKYVAVINGSVNLGEPGSNFIPYNDVTKENAISWVMAALQLENLDEWNSNLDAQINAKMNPTILYNYPNW